MARLVKKCPRCWEMISVTAMRCPSCRYRFRAWTIEVWLGLALAAAVIVSLLV